MRFPIHLQANLHTSATEESSEEEESEDAIDGKGPQCTQKAQYQFQLPPDPNVLVP